MVKTPKNKESTRYFSDLHEKSVCADLGATQQPNSGGGKFRKGDVVHKASSTLIECKTCTSDKDSFSIKKEWFAKNEEEMFSQHLSNSVIAFNFGPGQENYYVINKHMMRYLLEKLEEEQ